jgi:hypothetical protein
LNSPQPPNRLNRKERRERKGKPIRAKTAKALADEHVAQVLGYLKSAGLEHGLLINFGSYKLEMRKFARSQDAARRKSKPTFLLSAVSAFFAFFAV